MKSLKEKIIAVISIMWIFGWKGPSGFSARSTAEEVTQGIDGTGLTAIVTGASSGLGLETTRVLALHGVHVIMAVRNTDAGRDVKEAILKEIPTAIVDVMDLDLSSLSSVRKFASEYKSSGHPLNILINNAGIMATPFMLSHDNIELQFATNHLGHFLLTNLLLDTMKKTASESNKEGRIVIVSSEAHRFAYSEGIRFDTINDESGYNSMYAYGQSKLANILHASELARHLKAEGVDITANSLHPGSIVTNLLRHHSYINAVANMVGKYMLKNVHQGAAIQCYLALHPQVKGVSGEYFVDSNIANPTAQTKDTELAKKLWDFSLSLTEPNFGIFEKSSKNVLFWNKEAGTTIKEAILKEIPDAKIDVMELDLSSLASVRKFAADYIALCLPLNILINNAGVMASPFKLSQDNIELQFATNHLGHFLLTDLLLETMKSTSRESNIEGRIVNLSSLGHQHSYREGIRFDAINDESRYSKYYAYGQSKLANILHAKELNRPLKDEGVEITANAVHPGAILTNLMRYDNFLHYVMKVLRAFITKSIPKGAASTCFVALHEQVKGVSGEYFVDCNVAKPSSQAKDAELATELWDFSLTLTNVK